MKRILAFNANYGRHAFILGVAFIIANLLAGGLNFYMGSGGWIDVVQLKVSSPAEWAMLMVPYYAITEWAPGIIFGIVMAKYGEIMAPQ